jgi:hypothetical protein
MTTEIRATTELFWKSTIIVAAIDLVLVSVLAWRIKPARFRQLKWPIAAASLLFWSGMWSFAMWGYWWDLAYRYVFPARARYVIPPAYGLLFAAAGLLIWWLAGRVPGNPVVNFCLLGGLVSLPGHLLAIYVFGMFDKVPLLQAASPFSALVFGVFEFIVYYSLIQAFAVLLGRGCERWHRSSPGGAAAV